MSLLLISCVGTVKKADPDVTFAVSTTDKAIQDFAGIDSVKTTANDKVELYFPAVSGDSDNLAYVIRYGGQIIPTYVQATNLKQDYRGLLKFTVTGLQTDTRYDFTVQARNITTGAESTNALVKGTKTFSNLTANFRGITQVRNLAGADGLNGIEVFWSEAEKKGASIKNEIDPIEYQITVINGNALTPGNMNDTTFTLPYRRVSSIAPTKRSAIVNGLIQNTKYYVQVRAVHHGTSSRTGDLNYKSEENTIYLEISTYSDDLADLSFDNSSFATGLPAGSAGLYSLNASWKAPVGNFDHYRIYYSLYNADPTLNPDIINFLNTEVVNPFCYGEESANKNIFCVQSDFNLSTTVLSGLSTNTKYNVALAVCLTTDCTQSKRAISDLRTHTTTPNVANFSGIMTIGLANTLNDLNKLFLNFLLPNFTSGNIEGYVVEYYGSDSNNPNPVQLNNTGTSMINGVLTTDAVNDSGLTVEPFNYLSDTQISISGIDPTANFPYCFLIYPVTYNSDGSKNIFKTGLTPKCKTPRVVAPVKDDFPGVNVANSNCNPVDVKLSAEWTAPADATGVYNKFEFYYLKTDVANPASFNFSAAVNLEAGYTRIILDSSVTAINFFELQPGYIYRYGVLTRYQSIKGVIRSEYNNNIGSCTL